ncbi:uncharacterized protein LOC135219155 [Macrobrachium nipponense]|uniref:uncharacterized protein LOC135219155 n=1 Tax=Macrobrachium nipponense TaxID=159736 RepID=UPI0030C7C59D
MKNEFVWLSTTAIICLAGFVAAAPPLDAATHRDGKIFPSEYGSDEEVRQLLNLKELKAQLDSAAASKDGPKAASSATPGGSSSPSASPSSPSSSSSSSSSGAITGMAEQEPKKEAEKPANQEGNSDEKSEKEKKSPSHLDANEQGRLEAGDHPPVDTDHIELKRQQLSKPHMRYTPLDLALYVYKTGDEEGVTLAIQELIAEGLMTAEEALNYLREIRENLHYLNLQDEQEQGQQGDEEDISVGGLKSMIKKNSLPLPLTEMSMGDPETVLNPDMDYGLLLERLRGQDYVSTEYSLEDVIYQMAKILFKQAMHRDIGSEKALQEVAALLEREAARGAITPEVEKKVLDIVVNSLVDSMNEENEFPAGPGPLVGGTNFKLPSQSSFSLGNSPPLLGAGSGFKHAGDFFQLSKTTTKREAPEGTGKKTEDKN